MKDGITSIHWPTLLGLVFIGVFLFAVDKLIRPSLAGASITYLVLVNIALEWLIVGALLGVVLWWERASIASLGVYALKKTDFWHGLGLYCLGLIISGFVGYTLQYFGLNGNKQFIEVSKKLLSTSPGLLFLLAASAGITEELIFRGYLITRLTRLVNSLWFGAAISYVLFVTAHIPLWGPVKAVQIAGWSLVPTIYFIKTKNIMPCIIMHFLNDALAFLFLAIALSIKVI